MIEDTLGNKVQKLSNEFHRLKKALGKAFSILDVFPHSKMTTSKMVAYASIIYRTIYQEDCTVWCVEGDIYHLEGSSELFTIYLDEGYFTMVSSSRITDFLSVPDSYLSPYLDPLGESQPCINILVFIPYFASNICIVSVNNNRFIASTEEGGFELLPDLDNQGIREFIQDDYFYPVVFR